MKINRPKGTCDILPGESLKWQKVENTIKRAVALFNYKEIRTPIFEHTELFLRGVGDTTDIVDKEMYTFEDKGDRSITLRPEGTASVVRAFVENSIYGNPLPAKMYYQGPMFRYSRPQAGRYRQFTQFGVEVLGSNDPNLDGEVVELAMVIFTELGLKNISLEINSVGCPSCRPKHKETLKAFLKPHFQELCETCQSRYEKNPLRVFDCKNPHCQEIIKTAPTITQCLCEDCQTHFTGVKEYLSLVGVQFKIVENMVRGLDYYTKTAFEIVANNLGAQSSIGGGGRYDGLVELLGGPATPGIGFALGMERIILAMEEEKLFDQLLEETNVFIITVSENEKKQALEVAAFLRKEGIATSLDVMDRSFRAQLKYSNKIGATHIVTIGEEECLKEIYPLKDMATGETFVGRKEEIREYLKGVNKC